MTWAGGPPDGSGDGDGLRMQGDELERTLEAAGVVLWQHDLRSDTISVSRSAGQLFSTKGIVVPRSMDELRGIGDPQGLLALDWAPPGPDEPNRFVEEVPVRFGRRVHWMRVVGSYLFDAEGTPIALRGTFVDVTAERMQAERMRTDEELLRRTVEISGDAFVALGADGVVTHWNPAAERMFGWTAAEAVGLTLDHLTLMPEDADRQMDALAEMLDDEADDGEVAGSSTTSARCKDGSRVAVEVSWVVVPTDDGHALRMFARDVSDRVAYEQKLTEMALRDQLTGLPNRTLLLDRLDGALRRLHRADGAMLALLFIDLDRFKVFNDSLGHAAGDQLLVDVARRLEQVVRPADAVARFGGDEMVVLCEQLAHVGEAVAVARRIIDALAQPFAVAGREHFVTVSIGIAPIEQADGICPEDVIRDADAAMYRAKASGGGGFELFDQRMREEAVERLSLETELNLALRRGDLEVHYQPMVDLEGRPRGCEALVRWPHADRGMVPPAAFIPIAEETGLVVPLGTYVLDVACRDLRAWIDRHAVPDGFRACVNVSSRQLQQPGFVSAVSDTLARHGVPPSLLGIELTETVLMQEGPAVTEAIDGLHQLGVSLAVDDFGTGYSSLVYLRRFPIDVLKIDQMFVAGLQHSDADRSIVVALVGLARSLGLTAVAEGVEDVEQLAVLRELGCERAQGHLWSAALPADQVEALLFEQGFLAGGELLADSCWGEAAVRQAEALLAVAAARRGR